MDIFSDKLFRDLEKLNFTVNESKVYLTLLRLGPSHAGLIAKEANLDRSSTYNALEILMKKGVVATMHETKRTIFVPQDPKSIVDYYREKQEIADSIIPSLREQFEGSKEKSSIMMFRGFKGVKTIFQEMVDGYKEGDTHYILGSEGQFRKAMPYYAPILKKQKEEKRMRTKLVTRIGRTESSKWKYAEYRAVPSEVESPATINIYGDKVAIFLWDAIPEAITIKNEKVSRTLKNYFEFMWKHAKKC